MHNPALAELGLDWRYLAFEVAPDELGQAIAGAKAMRYIGLNLTVPHKLLALDMVDVLDESAETWGAVNTICFEAKGEDGMDAAWPSARRSPGQGLQHRCRRHHARTAAGLGVGLGRLGSTVPWGRWRRACGCAKAGQGGGC